MTTINNTLHPLGGKETQTMEKFLKKFDSNKNELYQAGELVLVGCVLIGMMIPIASLV
jgi:hypothetical protein